MGAPRVVFPGFINAGGSGRFASNAAYQHADTMTGVHSRADDLWRSILIGHDRKRIVRFYIRIAMTGYAGMIEPMTLLAHFARAREVPDRQLLGEDGW
jgi:hypothetical protein